MRSIFIGRGRYFDLMLARALSEVLPDGKYPDSTSEYLKWNDNKVLELLAEKRDIIEAAGKYYQKTGVSLYIFHQDAYCKGR